MGIARRTTYRTTGWQIEIKRHSGTVSKLFSDGRYGGKARAYRAAQGHLKAMERAYLLLPRLERMRLRRRNNRSGVSGVYRWPADGSDIPGAYWAAQWVEREGEPPRRRKFSTAKYGEATAKKKAVEVRRQALSRLED